MWSNVPPLEIRILSVKVALYHVIQRAPTRNKIEVALYHVIQRAPTK
jgi:hypothetical protein